ncbi:MAG: hypothetical protein MUO40_13225 [Anaerolineaceae bacterium]|nr:hypothetical protein [Anaerolineaceae bacterium]
MIKRLPVLFFIFISMALILIACGQLPATPTLTPQPTFTSTIPPTSTATPTKTPRPTNTPTTQPTLSLGDVQIVGAGGFSFQPIINYYFDIREDVYVEIYALDNSFSITLYGNTISSTSNLSAEEIIDEFLSGISESGSGYITKGIQNIIHVDGLEGISFKISGVLYELPFTGQAILVIPNDSQVLFGLGVAITKENQDVWEREGARAFDLVLSSIKFIDTPSLGECPISTDNTYGYSEENPIQVSGDWMKGPAQERKYLDNLRGPNGEPIQYERLGSLPFGDTILDEYQITFSGKVIILYLDVYNFNTLYAPAGLTCSSAFSQVAP